MTGISHWWHSSQTGLELILLIHFNSAIMILKVTIEKYKKMCTIAPYN
jgi:hypothetical protein